MSKRTELCQAVVPDLTGKAIVVGDVVAVLTCGSGFPNFQIGTYVGRHPNGRYSVDVNTHKEVLLHRETGQPYDFRNDPPRVDFSWAEYSKDPQGTQARYQQHRAKRMELEAKARRDYVWTKVPHKRRTTLQRNRVWLFSALVETQTVG